MGKVSAAEKIAAKLASKTEKLASKLSPDEAVKILEKFDTVEAATALRGPERQQYLDALDTVYGDRTKRAKDLGFSDDVYYHGSHRNIKEFHPEKASPEGFMGKSIYLTNDPADASWNYAHPEGPDVKNKIERVAERLQDEKGLDYSSAQEKAYKKVIGRVDSGAVYPLRTSAKSTADMRPGANQWIDLNPEYNEAGDLVSENPIAQRIAEGIQRRATEAESRLEGERILGKAELYDEKQPAELFHSVKNAAQERDLTDKTGGYLSSEFGRGALEDAGYDSVKINADYEFNMPNTSPDTEHLMVFDPSKIRSTNAAFDPRFKDSANILALTGNQAPKIAARMLKPHLSLGQAFSDITEPIEQLDAPVNTLVNKGAEKFAQLTDLKRGAGAGDDETYQPIAKAAFNNFAGTVAPTPSNLIMGGVSKALPIFNAVKPGTIANSMRAEKSAAEMYREAKAASGQFGATTVLNTGNNLGKVIVKEAKPVTNFGTVTVKP